MADDENCRNPCCTCPLKGQLPPKPKDAGDLLTTLELEEGQGKPLPPDDEDEKF